MIIFRPLTTNITSASSVLEPGDVVLRNLSYGNSFQVSYKVNNVRGLIAKNSEVTDESAIFRFSGDVPFMVPLVLMMKFESVREDILEAFIQTILRPNELGKNLLMINFYDSMAFPDAFPTSFPNIHCRKYQGHISDFSYQYDKDSFTIASSSTPSLTGNVIPTKLATVTINFFSQLMQIELE